MSVMTGPENGPQISPVSPEDWNTHPTVFGVRPTAATTGIRTGAMIAQPPANVPSRPQITTQQISIAMIAFFSLFTPMPLMIH